MKRGLVFIGGGGHCKSVADALSETLINAYDEIVITDSIPPLGAESLLTMG